MEQTVQSPCTNLCVLDSNTNICQGCFRTIEEIVNWIRLTEIQKQEVLKKIEKRRVERNEQTR